MTLAELRKTAKEKLKGHCRVCPVCDGRACAGEVPGMGGAGTGAAFRANLEALARLRFNLRTVHEAKTADTSVELFGLTLAMPILGAPMTGSTYNMGAALTEQELAEGVIGGSALAGGLGMIGGTILHSHRNVIRFTDYGSGANLPAARALFMGRQAGVIAYGTTGGMRFSWQEEVKDAGNEPTITSGFIGGIKKARFNNKDFGVLSLDTYAKDPNAA